ncbi:LysR substrate-binding domain-containing protein [Amycolatopsis rhabdoformis]|uniref:LysR substrate-binding domain-containing protein n=1 Tax=Amycolatopsis rhabdoformis TaxID=1448059 RepID=A0ABZ1IJN5_9PSEU|nr:LysR substrate-binding domain-containing protein [Amycolatopsis rhabdoformis]WSE34680.1 LysR substrate-binding domain-containing protein [Amycolatopsis rhabdoformis]
MDLRQLRYFLAVGEELSFARAAARLRMSQPPLSQRIQELERELGCLLLDRTIRPIRLTESGRILLDEAREILARVDLARERTRSAGRERIVTIGVVSEAVAGFLASLSTHIRAALLPRHPGVSLRVRVLGITSPAAGLHTGQSDIALTRLPFDTQGIATRPLGHEPLVAAVRSDDDLAERTEIDAGELRDHVWCQLPLDADPRWREYWLGNDNPSGRDHGHTAGPVVHSLAEYVQSVAWEGAVGVLPSSVARLYPAAGVTFVPLAEYPENRLVLAWPTTRADQVVLDVVEAIEAAVAAHGSAFFR